MRVKYLTPDNDCGWSGIAKNHDTCWRAVKSVIAGNRETTAAQVL